MPEQFKTRPADGGSYRRNKDGSYTRLDKPQTPDPGKTARRKQRDSKGAAKAAKADSDSATNVRDLRDGKKEK